jgi:hypothetical protein
MVSIKRPLSWYKSMLDTTGTARRPVKVDEESGVNVVIVQKEVS